MHEFLWKLALEARITLHVIVHYGQNTHHMIEAVFKALGRALDEATASIPRVQGRAFDEGSAVTMIAIIDYGMGNLHSVSKAVERLGYEAVVTADAAGDHGGGRRDFAGRRRVRRCDGEFARDGSGRGRRGDMRRSGKPLLGICLGMQLLFSESEEHGRHEGLGLAAGHGRAVPGRLQSAAYGLERADFRQRECRCSTDSTPGHVYFVHSYHAKPERESDLLAVTDYHGQVTAIVGRGNVYGMQFHPEKSGELGMSCSAISWL